MIHRTRVTGALLATSLLITGCAPSTMQPHNEAPMPTNLHSVTAAALKDAERQTGLEPEMLSVVSAAAVTWRDGSLGCPQPGMMYTMALVPGYRVQIQASGRLLDYHASARGQLMLCPQGRATEPSPQDAM